MLYMYISCILEISWLIQESPGLNPDSEKKNVFNYYSILGVLMLV